MEVERGNQVLTKDAGLSPVPFNSYVPLKTRVLIASTLC